jgi:hypothetical protein
MKRFLVFVALAAGVATADDESPFLKGEALSAEIARNCADGCVVLSPAEAAALQEGVAALIARKQQEAFDAGRKHEYSSCRNRL